jgi:hypothetical protein
VDQHLSSWRRAQTQRLLEAAALSTLVDDSDAPQPFFVAHAARAKLLRGHWAHRLRHNAVRVLVRHECAAGLLELDVFRQVIDVAVTTGEMDALLPLLSATVATVKPTPVAGAAGFGGAAAAAAARQYVTRHVAGPEEWQYLFRVAYARGALQLAVHMSLAVHGGDCAAAFHELCSAFPVCAGANAADQERVAADTQFFSVVSNLNKLSRTPFVVLPQRSV